MVPPSAVILVYDHVDIDKLASSLHFKRKEFLLLPSHRHHQAYQIARTMVLHCCHQCYPKRNPLRTPEDRSYAAEGMSSCPPPCRGMAMLVPYDSGADAGGCWLDLR